MGDNELGGFLRARREALTPELAGLPAGPRRRTPGLRRAELATLAGVSVEYLTRLEQGRDRRPSPEIITALAEALRLSPDERLHLHRLSKVASGAYCADAPEPDRTVRPAVRALLAALEPAPAVVVSRIGEVLARTEGFARLAGPLGLLDGEPPSLAYYVFTDPRARLAFPDWDTVAAARAAELRTAASLGDTHAAYVADELRVLAGPSFTGHYAGSALPARTGVERWAHPRAGELRLFYECLALPETDEQQLVVRLAADAATEAALTALTEAVVTR
ncbi:helix-turn-helix domain-containing protein [Actinomadura flavalba]|uniref:helix-turn-helix domain-containing protein n=1 Tax=Actinomadura flavalba TaxID=1120938 RepID=UPI0003775F47|nr:helix-turn-helix transcriptional regulator [Actinomadura flavalba]